MNKLEYVFYSGGFDTTSYLLQSLLEKKNRVQPIVVKVEHIDGGGMVRNSIYQEQISRENFYYNFKKKYPELKHKLLDEITFNDVVLDESTLKLGKSAFTKGIFSREVNQLLYFHQICVDNDLDAVVGYQKDDDVSGKGWEFIEDNFKFKIPLKFNTKKDILKKAIEIGYDSFLYETWSCWHPLPGNKPCKVCDLYKITIVETKLKFPPKTKLI